jgi:XTP/dITP diphosphohydrolase
MRLIFSTHNQGKLKEIKMILSGFEILGSDEIGIHEDVEEDGVTLTENALKKARYVAQKSGEWTIADDSGLFIKALGGEPGVKTARWAGDGVKGMELIRYVLERMKDIPVGERQGYFESVAALVAPDGRERIFTGRMEGEILEQPVGNQRPGLPYDVIFKLKDESIVFSEMTDEAKNAISHRGRAFQQLKEFLLNLK